MYYVIGLSVSSLHTEFTDSDNLTWIENCISWLKGCPGSVHSHVYSLQPSKILLDELLVNETNRTSHALCHLPRQRVYNINKSSDHLYVPI